MAVVGDRLPFPERGTARRSWPGYAAAFPAAVAFQLVTPSGRSHLDHVWAEDGARFLLDAVRDPFLPTLVAPYGGYLHVVPRLSAELVSLLPLEWAAVGFALAAAVPRALVALLCFAASAGHLRSTAVRAGLASLVVVLPVGNSEPAGNVTNLHWFLLFGAFWALLWRSAPGVPAALFAVLATLSSPLGFLLAPIALLRLLGPDRRDRVVPVAFLAATAVQGVVMTVAERTPYSNDPVDPVQVALAALLRVPVAGFTGSEQVADFYPRFGNGPVLALVLPAAAPVVAALCRRDRPGRLLAVLGVACAAAVVVVSLVANWTVLFQVQQPGVVMTSQRYSVLPCLFLFTAVAVGLDTAPSARWASLAVAGLRVAVAGVVLVAAVQHVRDSAGVLDGVAWGDGVAAARAQCAAGARAGRFVHEPDGWFFELPCRFVDR